ncbi:pyridoxamine kinase [Lacrimispora sp. 210928-DFI.3.58]|uniref:pyridoxamine kinase n=1 Tax=Lacrimispora sp. 210928-DFI.3.58 TaxID=2883214 RepID=UPI001D06404B|nr:pyridoxamine kinase [Lacrimispora sp. 210928-DFI.3.58]MCB7319735.1 pyridoxamine kinase [Lacrimispora sp. 210928-DFI.3.58]
MQKKIAMINDLSGYGRCSLTVALPVLSAMKLQCCPVPTSILSNHTGFPVYFFDDYTEKMKPYVEKWKELGLTFDGIATGFLGSEEQIELVMEMIKDLSTEGTKVIIDPIMGDNGSPYATYTPQMCRRMGELVSMGDIVTPNLTEACILTGRPYKKEGWSRKELAGLAEEIRALGPDSVVITGISQGQYLVNAVAAGGKELVLLKRKRVGRERPGTGDVFSSVVAGAYVRGWDLTSAVGLAADFVKECIRISEKMDIPVANGVCFEEILDQLIRAVRRCEEAF